MMKKVYCEFCGIQVPSARLKVLPETTTCVKCSQTEKYSEAEIIGPNGSDDLERNRLNIEDFDNYDPDSSISISTVD